jgi:spermidine/putrescine transport system substrate-binding protein
LKKILKSTLAIALLLIMALSVFSGCKKTPVVYVYNWGEYIDESLFNEFTRETGITVKYKTFDTNESLYSVMKQGGVSYDVIIPSDYMASRMIDEGMLEKLNFDNIPNFSLISDDFKNREYDTTGEYTVPYMWGVTGIIYNTSMISDTIDSWGALFDEKYSGQILMFDNSRDAFGVALKYLGYSLNTTDAAELDEAFELLKRQKPLLQMYVMDQIYDKLESGEAAIGPYYAGDYLTMIENNPDLAFVVPKEGANQFVDLMCIPKGAANKENAEKFINFMTGTDASAANSEFIGYTSPNKEAEDVIELDDDARAVMYPGADILSRCEFFINLPQATLDKYDGYWVEIKK